MLQQLGSWAASLKTAVDSRRGGEVASLFAACPNTPSDGLPSQTLLDMVQGHALTEVAYFELEAAQAPSAAKRLRFQLCAFDAFQQQHTAPRQPPVGWDTAVLVTSIQRIRSTSSSPGALDANDDDDGEDTTGAGTATSSGGSSEMLGTMIRSWRKLFLTLKELDPEFPNSQSRRRGALAVLNGLLGILFLHNNTHQARIVIKSVDDLEAGGAGDPSRGVLGPCGHMVAEVVRYCYYQGRMRLYDRDPIAAFAAFREASRRLPPHGEYHADEVRTNKLRVHFYWSVAGLAAGVKPPVECLLGDPILTALVDSVNTAVEAGSEAAFDAVVAYYAPMLKIRGVYSLLIAMVRPQCLLARLMRLHAAVGRMGRDNSRLPLKLLLAAEAPLGDTAATERALAGASFLPEGAEARSQLEAAVRATVEPLDDLALQLAQLIGIGKVRGYVAMDGHMLVLSKKEPFPPPAVATPLAVA
jgi:hypothetical protein